MDAVGTVVWDHKSDNVTLEGFMEEKVPKC